MHEVCFLQREDGIRDGTVTGVQTCALPISCGKGEAGSEERLERAESGDGERVEETEGPDLGVLGLEDGELMPSREGRGGHSRKAMGVALLISEMRVWGSLSGT